MAIAALMAFPCSLFAQSAGLEAQGEKARIVSIGGDITEIIYALGEGQRIVAVDATSQFPPQALREKRTVGYMRTLSTEGVLSVGATIVIASERSGPPEVVNALKSAMPYVEVPEGTSAEGVPDKVMAVAQALGVPDKGTSLAAKIKAELEALAVDRQKIKQRLRALFVLNTQSGRVVVGGSATSADAILHLAGLENVAAAVDGFRPVSDESLLGMRPDVAVAMLRSSGEHDGAQALSLPALSNSPAARNHRIIAMDGLFLLGFGPRVADAARQLLDQAYGSGTASKLPSK